jgi:hypothetical protein
MCAACALFGLISPAFGQERPRVDANSKLFTGPDAPVAYLGTGLKLKEQPDQQGAKGSDKFVIAGAKPREGEGLDPAASEKLAPVDIQVGTKSGKPVFLQVFTNAANADGVAAEFQYSSKLTEISNRIRAAAADVTIQACAPPAAMVCSQIVKDEHGSPICKEYKCERKKQ